MPHVPDPDDSSDEIDPEGPDESEMDYSDKPDLEVCPHCRKMVYEDAEQCPHCGEYLSAGDAPLSRTAWIVIGIVGAMLLALLLTRM